ncbi:MAG: S-adenosylmethionine:tRNA ribosyltransferase-isomerase, partial [Phycisphaeraceae bacterium]|nr:S-adenosylmethionine:tRNA ribosyltransferase-isomerase [Phycisphaeraceae bacterium]
RDRVTPIVYDNSTDDSSAKRRYRELVAEWHDIAALPDDAVAERIRTDRLDEHVMHSEWLHIPASTLCAIAATRDAGGRLIPVGTTSVRALESLPRDWRALMESGFETSTDLFITPGFTFRFAEALLTNFHLPRSTLLALVGALCTGKHGGIDQLKRWYAIAVEEGYRFYSYGDAMLIV